MLNCPEKITTYSESIRKLNLLEPVDLERKSQFHEFDNLVNKFLGKTNKKAVLKKIATKEEIKLKEDLTTQITTLQQLKELFLEFIETAMINEKTKTDFLEMLVEMKGLYNQIIGNRMYKNKNEAIDEVSLVLDVCNRYKGQFQTLQEYVKRGGKWETALSMGIEEGLGRSSFGENHGPESEKKKRKNGKEDKGRNSELVKYNSNQNNTDVKTGKAFGKDYNNPFENSSIEEQRPSAKLNKSREEKNKKINKSSSFKHLERADSAHTMEELRNFIIKEKIELENEIVSLKMKLEKRDQELLEARLINEKNSTKIRSLTSKNKDLKKQVKEYKEEIYARILNITMTSNKTGSHSVNKFDSSHKINYKGKYREKPSKITPIRRSTSFLSKPEDRIEKTKREPERFEYNLKSNKDVMKLEKKNLTNSKAFLQDFNKEISSILNRTSKPEEKRIGKRHGSQKRMFTDTEPKAKYSELLDNKLRSYTATKGSMVNLRSNETGGNNLWEANPKKNSNKFVGQDYGDISNGRQYPNRMAYTLNLAEDNPYGANAMQERDYFAQRGSRLDGRPNSRANDHMFNPRQMERGLGEDPRYPSNLEDLGNFRASLYGKEGGYSRGMEPQMRNPEMMMNMGANINGNIGGNQERDNGFDAAKKLEKYKNQMNMKFGGDTGYGCLLYTSPSPRDLSTSRMPSSA